MRESWPFILSTSLLFTLLSPSILSLHPVTSIPHYDVHSTNMYWDGFDEHVFTKRTTVSSSTYEYGRDLIENDTLFIMRYWDSIEINITTMDWTEDPFQDRTWRFYFHSLRMVSYLLNAYEWTGQSIYLNRSIQFIDSWYEHNPTPNLEADEIAWDDHSAANRLTTLIYFWDMFRSSEIYDEEYAQHIHHILYLHGTYTADRNNYLKNHNHGIFQDRALLQLSVLFPSFHNTPYWYDLAMNRLHAQIEFGVTASGFHKEHSPSYHFLVMKIFAEINSFLLHYGYEDHFLQQTVYNMEGAYVLMTKADGSVPMLGDSVQTNIFGYKHKASHPWMEFVLTEGKTGTAPPSGCEVYQDAKLGIIQSTEQQSPEYYLLMTGAFHSSVHKHADDLSFVFSLNGEDIFVDSGKYNFNEKDPYRAYVRSTFAHNTVSLTNEQYDYRDEQFSNNPKVFDLERVNDGCKISMQHTLFTGVTFTRSIWMLSTHLTIIQDQIVSDVDQAFIQHFNIDARHQVEQIDNGFTIETSNGYVHTIQQFSTTNMPLYFHGSTAPIRGWQSNTFNEVEPIHWIGFQQDGKNLEFITTINSAPSNQINHVYSTSNVDCLIVELADDETTYCVS